MAACIYRCRKCKQARRVEMIGERTYEGYGRYGMRYRTAPGVQRGYDECCGTLMVGNMLRATMRPEVKCNTKCTHAIGFTCDCSCGGKNHGLGAGMFTNLSAGL